ncbi:MULTISPECIES: 3-oxoacyl-[acyl-carrier-protein] synthase III C-terminal domain-containing protein [unclassified Streptomyces]|uniref:3-oxoacyl-[acyl-carrier-protein] synthase III C-terminal domain-containing protein n=1 Tax=unclassified Streptomyces TaxID=2593676 RepID=UPI00225AE455|nr:MULTISPECIES: 3-oxoacyl-[acyl-carrier-protein] synthase III C-terminal domain-containing protein [unclassified Streptomyces]MCX5142751.1 3-oxoacyl-ACP synthase [Streptomyces sp. NBC_00338]WRZ67186.1 3-oxoacyl-ACP synthase [Streptomyces sp. NBC_01257]WSU61199.1 3-oxoacyl-ACP synthase [Streptomyces sp. NBC_01104]
MRFEGGLGVKAVTTWLPGTTETTGAQVAAGRLTEERGRQLGVTELPVTAELAAPEMAVRAGRRALARAGWDPERVGFLAHARVFHQGHEKWSYAHYIASELGLPSTALPFGIEALCTGGATGLLLAATQLVGDPALTGALVTTAERYYAPEWDRWSMHSDIGYGDGATAALLHRRDGGRDDLRLLSLTHSTASRLEGMERGNRPFTQVPMQDRKTWETNAERKDFYEAVGKEAFPEAARVHVRASLLQALEEAGLEGDDPRIRLFTMPRMGPRLVDVMYGSVAGLLKAETVLLGGRTGHLGAGDMLANMADIVTHRMLMPGEFAVVAGAGGGFTWSTAVVQAPEE